MSIPGSIINQDCEDCAGEGWLDDPEASPLCKCVRKCKQCDGTGESYYDNTAPGDWPQWHGYAPCHVCDTHRHERFMP
jgi:DnaJ-class molecular chaperone